MEGTNWDSIRVCKGLNTKGHLILKEYLHDHIENYDTDWYESVYYYNTKHVKQFEETGTVSGIKDVLTDKLVFDLDSKENVELAKQDAIEIINRLEKYNFKLENIEIYYSGFKGFHVIAKLPKLLTTDEVKKIVEKLSDNIKTIDTTVYNSNRIFRVPGTKHPKSGLYKVPLLFQELKDLSLDNIKLKAKDNSWIDLKEVQASNPSEELFNLLQEKNIIIKKDRYGIDFSKKASGWRNCKWSLLQGNFGDDQGERHHALTILAATCRGLGYDKDSTYYMCKSALKKQSVRTGRDEFPKDELWKNILEDSIFTDGWEGGQYSCQKDPWLKKYCESLGKYSCSHNDKEDPNVLEPDDLIKLFDGFIKEFDQNRIMTGIKSIDDNVNITIGQPIGILAAPSVGKTSLLLSILNNTCKQNLHSMFFSLDMYNVLVTQKLIQKFSKLQFDKLKDLVLNNPKEAVKFYEQMKDEMKHMHTVIKSGVTVADMRNIITEYEKEHGIKIKVVAIDYLELISGPFSDETANSAFNAKALRDLANDFNTCVIVLLQPQKTAEPDEPIKSYRKIKGASVLEQSFRIIFSLYRPGFSCNNPEEDKFIGINCVKNTMGPLFSTHLSFDGLTGNVAELSEEEYDQLENLVKRRQEEKNASKEKSAAGWE